MGRYATIIMYHRYQLTRIVFSKASNVLEDGKRLENLSWRLWNRETFCCCPETKARSTHRLSSHAPPRTVAPAPSSTIPELASSIDSASSEEHEAISRSTSPLHSAANLTRPELTRLSSLDDRSRGREKHITSCDFEKIVTSITQQQAIEPLTDLPPLAIPAVMDHDVVEGISLQPKPASAPPSQTSLLTVRLAEPQTLGERRSQHTTPIVVEQPSGKQRSRVMPQSSTSTVLTQESRNSSQTSGSPNSPATSISTHNVVRGFVPGGASSSYRLQAQLAPEPIPIKKSAPQTRAKKGASFMLGTSSESQDEGSMESYQKQPMSALARRLTHQSGSSLKQETVQDEELRTKVQSSPVFESEGEEEDDDDDVVDDDDDDDIDDDDDDEQDASDWEDEAAVDEDDSHSRDEAPRQASLFRRVDSKPSLTSHRSLLTSMMHEGDRVHELVSQASRARPDSQASSSTPSARPRRRQSPGQDTPPQGLAIGIAQQAQAQAINVPGSNGSVALSPRTTRRNMLATELTESLRRNLLWERQQKMRVSNVSNNLRRRHTAIDVKKLSQQQQDAERPRMSRSQFQNEFNSNEYLHTGIEEYHAKGW